MFHFLSTPSFSIFKFHSIRKFTSYLFCIAFSGFLGSVYVFLIFSMFFSSCTNNVQEAQLITSRVNVNIEKGTDVVINYSDNGLTKITSYGKTVTRYSGVEKPYLEFSDGMKLYFFTAQGDTESTLTARYATAVENSKEMIARDHVVVINNKGERLDTDELVWDEEAKTIYSNSFVKITTADEIIIGKGMTANQNFTDYMVKSISGTIKVKAEEMK